MGAGKIPEKIWERYYEESPGWGSSGGSYSIRESSFDRVVRMIDDVKSAYEQHDSDPNQRSSWDKHIEIIEDVYEILNEVAHLSDDPTNRWQQLQRMKNKLSNVFAEYEKYGHLYPGFLDVSAKFTRDSEEIFQRIKEVTDEIRTIKSDYTEGSETRTLSKALANFESFREKLDADIFRIQTHQNQLSKSVGLWKDFVTAFDTTRVNLTHRTPLEELGRFDLNKEQERHVSMNYDGHRRIQGASGSGKTVILIYRALRLSIENPEHTIRIFTINRSLADHLWKIMKMLHRRKLPSNIHIAAFYDFARDCVALFRDPDKLGLAKGNERIGDPDLFGSSWRLFYDRVSHNPAVNIFARADVQDLKSYIERWGGQSLNARRYLRQEMIYIQSALQKKDRQRYKDAEVFKRDSRSIPLNAKQRQICMDILEKWETKWLLEDGLCDIDGITSLMAEYVDNEESRKKLLKKFNADHILIDEFQDFSTLEMRILNQLFGAEETKQNLFFMVGDINQKVFSKHHHRSQAGFDFRGRSFPLRQNYRNTRQVLRAAIHVPLAYPPRAEDAVTPSKLIKQPGASNLDDNDANILEPGLSSYNGNRPIVLRCEKDRHAQTIFQLLQHRHDVSVAVVSENEDILDDIENRSSRLKIKCYKLFNNSDLDRWKEQQTNSLSNFIVLSRLEAVKGLEFDTVIVADMSYGVTPRHGTPQEEKWREAAIVYVALTRARDELIITYTDRPSEFVEVMKEHVDWKSESDISFMNKLFDKVSYK